MSKIDIKTKFNIYFKLNIEHKCKKIYNKIDKNNNEVSNECTSNDSYKKGKYSIDEINKELKKEGYEQGSVIDEPIYYNNKWCYLVSYMATLAIW